jgi:dTDP-4-dehydrorhamnose reductase
MGWWGGQLAWAKPREDRSSARRPSRHARRRARSDAPYRAVFLSVFHLCSSVVENMILLLGASGYIGEAFARELQRRKLPFMPLARKELNYTRFDVLSGFLKKNKPEFLINAAGYTGKPNVDACELARADTLVGNTLLPQTITHACAAARIPWGHVSSGCIFTGAKVTVNGRTRAEKDLMRSDLHGLVEKTPSAIHGFTETDQPNFTFRDPPCSFYSGTKALAEEAIAGIGQSYIWRLRIPFDEFDGVRNYLSKVQRYPKVYDNVNSISHRGDYAKACLDLFERRAPFGTYNVTNPGFVTTRQVVDMIRKILKPKRKFEFWSSDEEFYASGVKALRSNCVLDVSKLLATGVKIRPVIEALEDSLKNWRPEK